MARYAVINNNNIVDALIAADELDEIAAMFSSFKLIELADHVMCKQGFTYNPVDKTFFKAEVIDEITLEAPTPEEITLEAPTLETPTTEEI